MRLIDADALKKKADMRGRCLRPLVTAFQMCVTVHDIDDAPTIDAVPVVYGRWDKGTETMRSGSVFVGHICSRCGRFNVSASNYCPNCGAQMKDGE